GARATGVASRIKSIWNYTWQKGGRPVLGQMAHLVASITFDIARSCVMQAVVGVGVTPLGYGNGFLQSLRLCSGNIPFNTPGPGDLVGLFYSNRMGVCIPLRQGIIIQEASLCLVVLSVFSMLASYASRAAETLSSTSFLMAA
ncbi:hypothetical protein Tco_1435247, partial [Tanacetum coccineum]